MGRSGASFVVKLEAGIDYILSCKVRHINSNYSLFPHNHKILKLTSLAYFEVMIRLFHHRLSLYAKKYWQQNMARFLYVILLIMDVTNG